MTTAADIRRRLEAACAAPADARGSQLLVCGTRAPVTAAGEPLQGANPGEWRVLVLVQGEGTLRQVELSPEAAEGVAVELVRMAAVCRDGFAALDRRERERAVSK